MGNVDENETDKVPPKKVKMTLIDLVASPVFGLLLRLLTLLLLAYSGGLATYKGILEIAKLDTVREDSYILKKDIPGNTILLKQAISEIDHLIENGGLLGNDASKINEWLQEVLTFVQELPLEKDFTWQESPWQGQTMSRAEANIRWALQDTSLVVQGQKTRGVLKGLKAALSARVWGE